MSERKLLIGEDRTSAGSSIPITFVVPQGSVLGLTLWNLYYDGILCLPVNKDVKLISFVNDVAVVAVVRNAELIEELVNPVLFDVARWISANGLGLAPENSECVILTRKHSVRPPVHHLQGFQVPVKKGIRYLGVQFDTRLSFVKHATTVAVGGRRAAAAIGRLMPNVGGPSQSKRSLLMSVVHFRLLYGAQVWADRVHGGKKAEESLSMAQRIAALRVARCYRTVSDRAALVLARMLPVFLLVLERKRVCESRKMGVL